MKKYSRKREAILEKIRSTDTHPSAEWIYSSLKSEIPDLSLGTVYRNIAEFLREGLIISVGVVNGQERYDGTTNQHNHFICDECGSIIDIPYPVSLESIDQSVSETCGVKVMRHDLSFHGLCPNCI